MTPRTLALAVLLAALVIPSCGGCSKSWVKKEATIPLRSVYCQTGWGEATVSIDKPVEAYVEIVNNLRVLRVNLTPTSKMIRFLQDGEECILVSPEDSKFKRKGRPINDFSGSGLPIGSTDGTRLFRGGVLVGGRGAG